MEKPLVSVVTPCYNGAPYLHEYFDSILYQSYENMEMIFVNDGSNDDTEKIALEYKNIFEQKGIVFRYLYQENKGQSNAVNNGLKYVNGKYLIWPDSDDILHKDSVKVRVEFLENNPSYDVVRTNGYNFCENYTKKSSGLSSEECYSGDIFLDLILEKTYCACGCYMIRFSRFKDLYNDLIIPESSAGQNWQILIPMCGVSPCGYIDREMYYVRIHNDSHSRSLFGSKEHFEHLNRLKEVLLLGIDKSGRTDRDYKRIVEIKYYKKYYFDYIKIKDKENSRKYFELLKKCNELSFNDYLYYAREFQPIRFLFIRYLPKIIKPEKSIYDKD